MPCGNTKFCKLWSSSLSRTFADEDGFNEDARNEEEGGVENEGEEEEGEEEGGEEEEEEEEEAGSESWLNNVCDKLKSASSKNELLNLNNVNNETWSDDIMTDS